MLLKAASSFNNPLLRFALRWKERAAAPQGYLSAPLREPFGTCRTTMAQDWQWITLSYAARVCQGLPYGGSSPDFLSATL
jgi:hypothetical protein